MSAARVGGNQAQPPVQPGEPVRRRRSRASGYPVRPSGRLARVLAVLAALSLLASLLAIVYLDRTLPAMGGYAGHASRGLLVLFEDGQAPRLGNRLLAAGLAVHGIGLAVLPEPAAGAAGSPDDAAFAREIARLQQETGLAPDRFIVASHSGTMPALLERMARLAKTGAQLQPGGLILLLPDARNGADPAALADLPARLPAAIIAGADPAAAGHAADLFLWLTGEDSSLFPGFEGSQPLAPKVWLSVDGNRRLVLLPGMTPLNSGWSPRLNHVVVQTAAMALAGDGANPADRFPASTTVIFGRTLTALIALLLWVASPLFLILAKSMWPVAPAWLDGQARQLGWQREPVHRLPVFAEVLPYLPAAALALPAGRILAGLAGDSRLVTGYRFYAFLGIYGWLYFLVTWGRRHMSAWRGQHQADGNPPAPEADRQPLPGIRSAWVPTLVSGLLAAALLFVAADWLQATAGRPFSNTRLVPALLTLVPLSLLMLPAMLPFAHGFSHPAQGMRRITALMHGLLPALFLALLRLLDKPHDLAGALLATVSGMALLLAARAVARALGAPAVRAIVPALAGLMVLLLFRPFPLL